MLDKGALHFSKQMELFEEGKSAWGCNRLGGPACCYGEASSENCCYCCIPIVKQIFILQIISGFKDEEQNIHK